MTRALFFGTPAIAVPALEALASVAEVVGVVCQPDRPAGRGLRLAPPPVKLRAQELGLEVVQPERVRTPELAAWVEGKRADVAVVLAYGRILPPAVLAAPRAGCLNLHASLLPRHRGAAPIAWAILAGDRETGVSLMQMDEGLDTGPLYLERRIPIPPEATAGELADLLAPLAAAIVREELPRVLAGALRPVPQDAARVTLAPPLRKTDGLVPWDEPAQRVFDHVRAMTPWPGATSRLDGRWFRVARARLHATAGRLGAPGEIVEATPARVVVACGEGGLALLRGQLEGRRELAAHELVAGRALARGAHLRGRGAPSEVT